LLQADVPQEASCQQAKEKKNIPLYSLTTSYGLDSIIGPFAADIPWFAGGSAFCQGGSIIDF
jgi:hypothetical protein